MKKFLDYLYIVLVVIGWAWASGHFLMRVVLPQEVSQRFIEQTISETLGVPVHIGRVGLRWSGLLIEDLKIDTAPTEEEPAPQPLLAVKEIRLYWSPWALLAGKGYLYLVRVQEPALYITRQADGKYNFESLLPAEEPGATAETAQEETPQQITGGKRIFIRHLVMQNGSILFTDLPKKKQLAVKQIFMGASRVNVKEFFPFHINAVVSYQEPGLAGQEIKGGLALRAHLKELNFPEAEIRLKQLVLRHTGGRLALEGRMQNFAEPELYLHLEGVDLSEKIIDLAQAQSPAFFVDNLDVRLQAKINPLLQTVNLYHGQMTLSSATVYAADLKPQFYIPHVQANVVAQADALQNQINISSFTVHGLSSNFFAQAKGQWAPEIHFNGTGTWELDAAEIGRQMPVLQPYQLTGRMQGKVAFSEQDYSGQLLAQALGATVPGAGTLSDIHFDINVPDKNHAQIQPLHGKINQGKFTAQLSAVRSEKEIAVDIKASSERVALPALADKASTEETQEIPQLAQEPSSGIWTKLPPIKLQTEVNITSLDAPYLYGEDMSLQIDMAGIDPSLSKAQGKLAFQMGRGEIKDLARLTDSNILTGILFGSLNVVSRVVNSLNVFSVLSSLASSEKAEAKQRRAEEQIVQTVLDEQGREVNILVPYTPTSGNKWKFESFQSDIDFEQGLANLGNGMFISDMMSFNLTGDMNFKTRALDMNIQAAPGRHEQDGVMPLTLHIGGTMEDPQGSMQVLSSVTSLVTQSVGNNFASRSVKKGISSFFRLFKKQKEEEPETEKETAASNDVQP